jgi:hypothetical protein
MNKYKVKITHVFSELIDVEAENEESAKLEAKKLIESEDRAARPAYEATIPEEHWPVITEEDFNKLVVEQKEKLSSNIITP